MLDSIKMHSNEHENESDDPMQFLCFSPDQHDITLMPEPKQANPISINKRKASQLGCTEILQENESPEESLKRIGHRDVERKRRQEMSSLYTSLRSKLPKEYLQRKSISNDMHGAVTYINHLKEKLDGLRNKRDELKKLVDVGSCKESCFSSDHEKTRVTVQCSKTGIEVILKTCSMKGFPLSKFLSALSGEGMTVVSCTSTRVDEALIHVIESEMDGGRMLDQTKLQKRLSDMVYNKL